MRSKTPIPRSPRNLRHAPDIHKGKYIVWFGRALWAIGGSIATALVTFISQGPESIRKIPEIPTAVLEMTSKEWDDYRINRDLSTSWEYIPTKDETVNEHRPLRIKIQSKNNAFLGEINSPLIRKWTIYETALIEGRREDSLLHLTVFDFVGGERKEFAKIDILFQDPPAEGITDHIPDLVSDELSATTTWQIDPALPLVFTLKRATK